MDIITKKKKKTVTFYVDQEDLVKVDQVVELLNGENKKSEVMREALTRGLVSILNDIEASKT